VSVMQARVSIDPGQQPHPHDRFEIASVLLVVQGSLTLGAGVTALPFGIVEPGMRIEGLLSLLLAVGFFVLSRGVRRRRPWARRWILIVECFSVLSSVLLMLLPIGALRGPVPLLANLLLPTVIILLVSGWSRKPSARRRPGRAPRGPAAHPDPAVPAPSSP
jgi:hypothetical protein